MEPREVKTLLLLEAVGEEKCRSQRELSEKIKMSLGLVNTFIKQLTIRKIFKRDNLPGNRVRYTLTSKGILEKDNLTRQYLSHSISYYNEIKRRVSDLLIRLKNNGNTDLILYGTGELCEITCVASGEHNINNVRIIDDKKAGDTICGLKIYEEAEMKVFDFDAVVIMDFKNTSIIRKKLIDKSIPSDKIYSIFIQ